MRTGSSSLNFFQAVLTQVVTVIYFTASISRKHVTQVAEVCYHLSLSGPTWTSLCDLRSIGWAFPMHTYNQDLVSVVVARCIFMHPKVCSHCSRYSCCLLLYDRQPMGIGLQIMTFPFPAFTLNPFFSMASFHIKSLLSPDTLISSRESAMMTRSSAYSSSQGIQRSHYDFENRSYRIHPWKKWESKLKTWEFDLEKLEF